MLAKVKLLSFNRIENKKRNENILYWLNVTWIRAYKVVLYTVKKIKRNKNIIIWLRLCVR